MAFSNNKSRSRFELAHDGGVSFADYRERHGAIAITHVETPPELRGKGGAAKLMDEIVAAARAESFKVEPFCAYAVAYFKRHPEAGDVLA